MNFKRFSCVLGSLFVLASWAQLNPLMRHRLRAEPISGSATNADDQSGGSRQRNLEEVETFASNPLHREYFESLTKAYGPDFSKHGLGISMWAKKDAQGKFQYKDVATFVANARRAGKYVDVDDGQGLLRALEAYTAEKGCIPRLMIGTHGLGSNFGGNGIAGVYPEADGGFYLSDRFELDSVAGYFEHTGGTTMPAADASARMGHWRRKAELTKQIANPQARMKQFFETSATTDDLELRVKGELADYPEIRFEARTREVEVLEDPVEDGRGGLGRLLRMKKNKDKPRVVRRTVTTYEPQVTRVRKRAPVSIKFCKPCIIQIHACTVSATFGEELARISGCQTVWSSGTCSPVDFHGTGYDNGKMDFMWKAGKKPEHNSVRSYQESMRRTPFFGNFLRATPDAWGRVKIEDAGTRYVADEYGVSPEAQEIFDFERRKELNELIDRGGNPILKDKLQLPK